MKKFRIGSNRLCLTKIVILRTDNCGKNIWKQILKTVSFIFIFRFVWKRTSFVLGTSESIISWTIPEDVEPGEYRIRHNGNYRYILGGIYPYQGVSNLFEVMILPSTYPLFIQVLINLQSRKFKNSFFFIQVVAFGSTRRKRYYFA